MAIVVDFSPAGGCEAAVVSALNSAKKSVQILMYVLDNPNIVKAILAADSRGVPVECVFDAVDAVSKYSHVPDLCKLPSKVHVFLDHKHNIMHNKVLIVDGQKVLTGSFNYTVNAETKNAENLLTITQNPATAAAYVANFALHKGHSVQKWPNAGNIPLEVSAVEAPQRRV